MDNETLRKVQNAQLEIAKEFKRICEENDLKYMLDWGTLLGAVRHHGFIPWDDDMDFSMPRKDYDKFFEIASKMDTKYVPLRWDITSTYPHPFGKFVKKNTVFKEEKMSESFGIYIDIFPWDEYPESENLRKKYKAKLMIYRALVRAKCGVKTYKVNGKFLVKKWLKNLPFILTSWLFTKDHLIQKYDKIATQYNSENSSIIVSQCDEEPGRWTAPYTIFSEQTNLPFEDTEFSAPKAFDRFLHGGYGDYMQLPPVEERGNRHNIVELDFGE